MLSDGGDITRPLNGVKVEEKSNSQYYISTRKTPLHNNIIYKEYFQYL